MKKWMELSEKVIGFLASVKQGITFSTSSRTIATLEGGIKVTFLEEVYGEEGRLSVKFPSMTRGNLPVEVPILERAISSAIETLPVCSFWEKGSPYAFTLIWDDDPLKAFAEIGEKKGVLDLKSLL